MNTRAGNRGLPWAFTLVELLLSTAIIGLLMLVLLAMTDQTSLTWRRTTAKIEQFQQARSGFESMTRKLSQATLNTYYDYFDASGNSLKTSVGTGFVPKTYGRQSELRFISGPMKSFALSGNLPTHGVFFQAPLGFVDDGANAAMDNLLNTWGYFVEVGGDEGSLPTFLNGRVPARWRSRLVELMQPAERMSVYSLKGNETGAAARAWFADAFKANPRPTRVLAENIVALVVLPRLARTEELARTAAGKQPLAPQYAYDSTKTNSDPEINPKNQLPPVVQVTMVAIDETSASQLAQRFPNSATLGLGMSSLFLSSAKLEDDAGTAAPGDGDLAELEKQLVGLRAAYRVFTTNVTIRGAKWSKSQKN